MTFRLALLPALAALIILSACASDQAADTPITDFPGSERSQRIEAAESGGWPRLQDVPQHEMDQPGVLQ